MKQLNKIIIVCLAFVLIIGMVGCKKVENDPIVTDEYDKKLMEYSAPYNLYVDAVGGIDTNSGIEKGSAVKTLIKAKELVRGVLKSDSVAMNSDAIVVNLAQGTYVQQETLTFNNDDCGRLPVVYKGEDGKKVSISGGYDFSGGWTAESGGIYKKNIGEYDFRDLYVSGNPAVRARFPNASADVFEQTVPVQWLTQTKEFALSSDGIGEWPQSNIGAELIINQEWLTIIGKITKQRMDNNRLCLTINSDVADFSFPRETPNKAVGSTFAWLENKLEYLDSANEWYYDKASGNLYYKPDAGTDVNSLKFTVPILEKIIKIGGKKDNPVKELRFENLVFEYSNWTFPSENGYVENQILNYYNNFDYTSTNQAPAAVEIKWARYIEFYNNKFCNTAANCLNIRYGVKDIVVKANKFENIGGNAILCGSFQESNPEFNPGEFLNYNIYEPSNRAYVTNNVYIQNNYLNKVGIYYKGAVGVAVGYMYDLWVSHNEMEDIAYSAFSLGWAWGNIPPNWNYKLPNTVSGNQNILNNKLSKIMNSTLKDGAAIYTLGVHDPNMKVSTIAGNYINSQRGSCIYFDMRSSEWNAINNVMEGDNVWGSLMIHDFEKGLQNVTVKNSYAEQSKIHRGEYPEYPGDTLAVRKVNLDTPVVKSLSSDWSFEAKNIMQNAGILKEYRDITTK